ncbi:MAG: site-specific DNA-methyltransferase, partial [Bacteroidales bacterium]|nr:site-specific DNA-methyltransferase [Bacteroidales bacterium]
MVWEDKPEEVEEQLRANLPVLREIVERRILGKSLNNDKKGLKDTLDKSDKKAEAQGNLDFEGKAANTKAEINTSESQTDNYPNHILIEGDNLHALTALTFTHTGKIDLIYIDPPYNTGNKDFRYNDNYIDKDDNFRHSKWLSFMHKRLIIAKKLLSEKGIIFISIDDIEYAALKLLLDEVFNQNIINSITIKTSETSGVKMSHVYKKLPKIKEYLLIYSVGKETIELNPVKISKVDDIEKFRSYAKYYSKIISNIEAPVEEWIILPLKKYLDDNNLKLNDDEILKYKIENSERIIYRTNNKTLQTLSFKTETALVKSPTGLDYIWWEGKQMLFLKDYINEGLCDLWTDISTINLNKEICELDSFENGQKPLELIKRILKLYPQKHITILDFFAGSGTTLHATIQLNKEDSGYRQCILATNNEVDDKTQKELEKKGITKGTDEFEAHGICQAITYERNKRVILGYINVKGEQVEGLGRNNLRYYKTDFV